MKTIITLLNLKFNATQYKWGRRLFGGTWYLINPIGLSMIPFWSSTEIYAISKTYKKHFINKIIIK